MPAETSTGGGPALVTGGCGFIGRRLVRALVDRGRPVIALCRCSVPGPQEQVRWVVGDVLAPESYAAHLPRGGTVFHLAAARSRPSAHPEEHERLNVSGPRELAARALEAGVSRFVLVSTALVFGPSHGAPRDESDPLCVDGTGYVRSRVHGLLAVRELEREGLPLVTACPSIVYGPDEPRRANRITTHLRRLLRSRIAVTLGGGRHRRTLAFVDDVVAGILALEASGERGEWILGGQDVSQRELDGTALALAGRRLRMRVSLPVAGARTLGRAADLLFGRPRGGGYEATVSTLAAEWLFSSRKAETRLAYARTPLVEGLRRTLGLAPKGLA